ncbi:MAG: hypothetical protein RIF32_18930 [Leptospirales bacterium]
MLHEHGQKVARGGVLRGAGIRNAQEERPAGDGETPDQWRPLKDLAMLDIGCGGACT